MVIENPWSKLSIKLKNKGQVSTFIFIKKKGFGIANGNEAGLLLSSEKESGQREGFVLWIS